MKLPGFVVFTAHRIFKTDLKNNSVLKLVRSSSKMAGATLIGRILGLVREQMIAAYFGVSAATDAFAIAFRIPNMLRDLFAEGVFSSAFVPVLMGTQAKDPEKARKLIWSLFILLGMMTGVISLGIMVWAQEAVLLITDSRFASDPARFELTVQLVRLSAPFLVLVSLASLFMGALNTLKVFFVPALAPACFNLMMILSILFLPGWLESKGFHQIFALGVGVIAGGSAQLLIQLPMLIKKGFGPKWPNTFWGEEIRQIIRRLGVGTIGVGATQVNILVTTILATGTGLGAVSWLNYAFRLFQFPVGLLSVSVANSHLVYFGESWKKGDRKEAVQTLQSGYFVALASIVPAAVILYFTAGECVHIIFERGAFDREDTLMTAKALRFYALGLIFYGLYKVFSPSFFVLDRPKIPVSISIVAIVLNIFFCIGLTPYYGFSLLALGTSLSMLLNVVGQGYCLSRLIKLPFTFFFNKTVLKITTAGVCCSFVACYTTRAWFPWESGLLSKIGGLGGIFLISLATYVIPFWWMGAMQGFRRK